MIVLGFKNRKFLPSRFLHVGFDCTLATAIIRGLEPRLRKNDLQQLFKVYMTVFFVFAGQSLYNVLISITRKKEKYSKNPHVRT